MTCKDVPAVHIPSRAYATVLISGVRVSRVRLDYGVFAISRTLARLRDGWRFPALGGLRFAEAHAFTKGLHETVAATRHARGSRRALLRSELKSLRHLAPQLAKVNAGKLPTLVDVTVTWPHFGMGDYTFCLRSP